MKQVTNKTKNIAAVTAFRFAYVTYLILAAYLLYIGDYEWAVFNFGVALAFDPFDTNVKWQQRPTYQKVWLFTHLTFLIAGFAFIIFR